MSSLIPPSELCSVFDESLLSRKYINEKMSNFAVLEGTSMRRRDFLKMGTAAMLMLTPFASSEAREIRTFSLDEPVSKNPPAPTAPASETTPRRLGEIPKNFWEQPRVLKMQRPETKESLISCYWKDGKVNPDEYWRICALLRDIHENVMTTIDPRLLDLLFAIQGYYEAWEYNKALLIHSGFRTVKTNDKLLNEGAKKNSMHICGKAADTGIIGIPASDITALGAHFQAGGVGFYPSKGRGMTHLDTGRFRMWRG